MPGRFYSYMALLTVVPLIYFGCSKDDDDTECRYFELEIIITPEGSGSVEEELLPRQGFNPPTFKLTAVPNRGFVFKEWIYPNGIATRNPTYIMCLSGGEEIKL